MLINLERNILNKSFNKFLSHKPDELRNQRTIIENKTHNTTNDTKNNANSINNSSYQKTFSIFNESNCDSNSQTDRSSNNIKEIKLTITSKQIKNITKNLSKNENNINDRESIDIKNLSENNLTKIEFIQKWWKKFNKIILIQKCIKGFLIRRKMFNTIYFIKMIFKIIFKLIMNKIKNNIKEESKEEIVVNIYNSELKKINNKIKKFETNNKFSKNIKLNYHPSFNEARKLNVKKKSFESKENKKAKNESLKKIGSNNPINVNLSNNQYITTNSNKNFDKNKNRNKNKSKKESLNKISNKYELIANNIFNIYNNVKKFYENKNNSNNFTNNFGDSNYLTTNNFIKNKQKKNSITSKNNNINNSKNMKYKKMESRGSMKNINGKIIINKNNNLYNNNINNNSKTDRIIKKPKNSSNKEMGSILYLLKLKKAFLFWKSYANKIKIIQKLKMVTNSKTPANINKSLSIYSSFIKGEEKTTSIKTKKINLSNSLIELKLNIITPQKLNMNNNPKNNSIFNNYTKKINNKHSISVENNNSIINYCTPKPILDCSYNIDKENNIIKGHKKNKFSKTNFNNSALIINQYDRNLDIKRKLNPKEDNPNKIKNANMTKKLYNFYAIINLIDKHNKNKIIKKWFFIWKSLTNLRRNFINQKGIEEKIINFKSIKSTLKNAINESKYSKNSNNSLFQNNSFSNFSCKTESNIKHKLGHDKANTNINQHDLMTPNPLEKSVHSIFFKSNIKSNQIVYQKKLLVNKKMRNQCMSSNALNELAEDRNMNIIKNNNSNKEGKYFYQTITNNFFNYNNFINNNNRFNFRRNNFGNSGGKYENSKINGTNGIEETEIFFNQNKVKNPNNNFLVDQKNMYEEDRFNSNTINVNVIENYRNIDLKQDINENNKNTNNNGKGVITTKQINFKQNNNKRFKNNSHSQEYANNNQSF